MAIVIDQEKKSVNWFNIIIAAFVVIIIFALAYFIFFTKPELIDVVAPGNLSKINRLSGIQVDPTPVIGTLNKYFTNNYGAAVAIPTPGRANPFLPY